MSFLNFSFQVFFFLVTNDCLRHPHPQLRHFNLRFEPAAANVTLRDKMDAGKGYEKSSQHINSLKGK